jgi:hypothetical protein
MSGSFVGDNLRVEVKHHNSVVNRYTWEIYSDDEILPVGESHISFPSWAAAYRFGKKALTKSAKV